MSHKITKHFLNANEDGKEYIRWDERINNKLTFFFSSSILFKKHKKMLFIWKALSDQVRKKSCVQKKYIIKWTNSK